MTLAAAVLLAGCGQRGGPATDTDKLVYSPEVNKVDAILLERTTFKSQLAANGKVHAVQKAQLAFKEGGVLTEVNVSNGSHVRKGQVIAAIDPSEATLDLRSAQITLDKARLDLQDALVGQGYRLSDTTQVPASVMKMARTRSGYDAAENSLRQAEAALEATRIIAPFSGIVADISLKKYATATTEAFCTLIDDGTMEAEFSLLESEYALISRGLKVSIEPFAGSSAKLMGAVNAVNPAVDENGQVTVTATVRNDGSLIDGMNVKVLVEKDVPDQLVVPRSAVVIRDNLNVLFRLRDGKAQWTYVNVLLSNSDSYAVEANTDRRATLSPGDSVITSGNLNLADGSEVTLR